MKFCEQRQWVEYCMVADLGWYVINSVWKTFSRLFKAAITTKRTEVRCWRQLATVLMLSPSQQPLIVTICNGMEIVIPWVHEAEHLSPHLSVRQSYLCAVPPVPSWSGLWALRRGRGFLHTKDGGSCLCGSSSAWWNGLFVGPKYAFESRWEAAYVSLFLSQTNSLAKLTTQEEKNNGSLKSPVTH